MDVRWEPGAARALVWPDAVALLAPEVDPGAAERVWRSVAGDTSLGTFLDELSAGTGRSLTRLPPFAFVQISSEICRIAVRGDADIVVEDGQRYTGSGVTTWVESQIPTPPGLVVRMAGPDHSPASVSLPIRDGVVLAGALQVGASVAPRRLPAPPVSAEEPQPAAPEPEPEEPERPEPQMQVQLERPEPEDAADPVTPFVAQAASPMPGSSGLSAERAEDSPQEQPEVDPVGAEPAVTLLGPEPSQPGEPEVQPPAAEAVNIEDAADGSPAGRYASLFDESIVVSLEDAALGETGAEDGLGDDASQSSGFISGVPHFGAADVPRLAGAPAVARDDAAAGSGMHDGHTIVDASASGVRLATFRDRGQTVLATLCLQGHANPPQRDRCFVCDAPVEGRPERVPRPSLGRIRASTGEVLDLGGPVVAGRSPSAPAGRGGVMPRLLVLPFPHISSNHVEIRLEDWTVLGVDLHSRNGTFLRRQGQPPVRLPDTAVPLVSDDVLDFGHGVFIQLERLP